MTTILQTNGLTKTYKGENVVDQVNIHVQEGEVYGFIGQNSAGKTTTIRLLLNLLQASSGHVELFGEKVTCAPFFILRRSFSMFLSLFRWCWQIIY